MHVFNEGGRILGQNLGIKSALRDRTELSWKAHSTGLLLGQQVITWRGWSSIYHRLLTVQGFSLCKWAKGQPELHGLPKPVPRLQLSPSFTSSLLAAGLCCVFSSTHLAHHSQKMGNAHLINIKIRTSVDDNYVFRMHTKQIRKS